jgi:hypothetical protein
MEKMYSYGKGDEENFILDVTIVASYELIVNQLACYHTIDNVHHDVISSKGHSPATISLPIKLIQHDVINLHSPATFTRPGEHDSKFEQQECDSSGTSKPCALIVLQYF